MRERRWRIGGSLALACALAAGGLRADERDDVRKQKLDHERVREAVRSGRVLPLDQVLRRVAKDFDAPVIGVEFEIKNDTWIYEIVLMGADGYVVEVYVDAANGRLLKVKREGRTSKH